MINMGLRIIKIHQSFSILVKISSTIKIRFYSYLEVKKKKPQLPLFSGNSERAGY